MSLPGIADVLSGAARWHVEQGDCLDVLRALPDESIDAVVTDPPAGIAFMGKAWDHDKGGRAEWIAWLASILRECLRVLKPGAHALVWALPRTSHWTGTACEDAGFDVRDQLFHLFGSGFPKSSRVNRDPRFCQCADADHSGERTTPAPRPAGRMGTAGQPNDDVPPREGALRSTGRQADSLVGCRTGSDCDDAPARLGVTTGQASFPQRECAPERNRSGGSAGVREREPERSPSPALDSAPPASRGCSSPAASAAEADCGSDQNSRRPPKTGSDSGSRESRIRNKGGSLSACRPPSWHLAAILAECQACGKPVAEGLGTALKPSAEIWWLLRKPLVGTVAANVQRFGTGAINVDGCRVGATVESWPVSRAYNAGGRNPGGTQLPGTVHSQATGSAPAGRWPPNLLLSHAEGCRPAGTRAVRSGVSGTGGGFRTDLVGGEKKDTELAQHSWGTFNGPDGTEAVEAWDCAPGCPVAELDRQSGESVSSGGGGIKPGIAPPGSAIYCGGYGPRNCPDNVGYGDTGAASRFFPTFRYCAKASRAEREDGCGGLSPQRGPTMNARCVNCGHGMLDGRRDGPCCDSPRYENAPPAGNVRNHHPTVKSDDLMRWLVRLVTPPDGIILDCFAGSGSTGRAAVLEGFRFVGIEREADYVAIAKCRIAAAASTGHQPTLPGVAP